MKVDGPPYSDRTRVITNQIRDSGSGISRHFLTSGHTNGDFQPTKAVGIEIFARFVRF